MLRFKRVLSLGKRGRNPKDSEDEQGPVETDGEDSVQKGKILSKGEEKDRGTSVLGRICASG